jgi:glycerophosphoryl diester phosphodiesterase
VTPGRPFDLQAHRGGAGLWPENTLEAFGRALALGVSTLELDVHLTAEDDVVVAHDPALADAHRIRELTRADLPDRRAGRPDEHPVLRLGRAGPGARGRADARPQRRSPPSTARPSAPAAEGCAVPESFPG